jgi:hypothetical protein
LQFDAQRIEKLIENTLRADERRLAFGFDPVDPKLEPSPEVAALVCDLTSKGMATHLQNGP